jgi:hypothetical protein
VSAQNCLIWRATTRDGRRPTIVFRRSYSATAALAMLRRMASLRALAAAAPLPTASHEPLPRTTAAAVGLTAVHVAVYLARCTIGGIDELLEASWSSVMVHGRWWTLMTSQFQNEKPVVLLACAALYFGGRCIPLASLAASCSLARWARPRLWPPRAPPTRRQRRYPFCLVVHHHRDRVPRIHAVARSPGQAA